MKFTVRISALILLMSVLSTVNGNAQTTNGNAQTKNQSQQLPQPICVAVQPLELAPTPSERPTNPNSTQVQQPFDCALNLPPQFPPEDSQLSERDRLIKERFEQRIIPLGN
jgi:hypothetical protein